MNKKKIISGLCTLAVATSLAPSYVSADYAGGSGGTFSATAFPGAEGGGMYATGARGADSDEIEVYHVTNLNDSGTGSFRDAVSQGNRIVVFDVSGYVDLESNVTIGHPNMTILGQTAPGGGICFRGDNVKIGTDNVIVRYLRFRVGAEHADGTVTAARDGLEITDDCESIILDHCSVSWGTDENLSAYAVKNVTIQNCIIAEALNQSVHDKGEHSYAAIWGGVNLTVHHNLIATHKSRNPKIGTSETVAMTSGYTDNQTVVDLRNNVFYNWGDKCGYGAENGAGVNIVNNYYKPGPATPTNKRARIFEFSAGNKYQKNWSGAIYAAGNYVDDDSTDTTAIQYAAAVNEDNWQIDLGTGVYLSADKPSYEKLDSPIDTYINDYPIETTTAQEAYDYVLANAGARLPQLDDVDARIISDAENRTAPDGSKGSVGLVDDPADGSSSYTADDRGYPILAEETRSADYDTDGDGIPDEWEIKMGLNPENPTDSTLFGVEGRTYLEMYCELAAGNYDESLTLSIDDNNAVITGEGAEDAQLYVDDKPYAATYSYPDGTALISAGYNADGGLNELKVSTDGSFPTLEKENASVKKLAWDSLSGMKPAQMCISLSDLDCGVHSVTAISGSAVSNGAYAVIPGGTVDIGTQDGDFNILLTLNQIPTVAANSKRVLSVGDIELGAGCNESFEKTIYYNGSTAALGNAKYLRAERSGSTLTLYSGTSLLNWTVLNTIELNGDVEITLGDIVPDGERSAADITHKLVTETTQPQISIENVEQNQRLGFEESIDVLVTPDDGAEVQLIVAELNGEEITSCEVNIESEQTVSVPVEFDGIDEGELKISCVDSNLCMASDSVNVSISADPTPWQIADIGAASEDTPTAVSVTNDYTYKINAIDGYIGGTSDKCGYVYQQFTGDNRLYYRSRMQSGSQFGIMLRAGLDASSEMYWFGGEYNAVGTNELTYDLKHRTADGDTAIDYTLDNQSANLYFIAEKAGNTLNIYQTENSTTVYKTKTLLASIDVSGLGDTYYMGFAGVCGDDCTNPPDAGWVAMDNNSGDEGYEWSFDYGLDWLWQMQEENVLTPVWDSGTMLLKPGNDYTDRYVFHEYLIDSEKVPTLDCDITLTGEQPEFNLYLQNGDSEKAYKLTFNADGKLYGNGTTELGSWSTGSCHVTMKVDYSSDGDKVCFATVTDESGSALITNAEIEASGADEFRTQTNTAKKTAVTDAVYFEPSQSGDGEYRIDNVKLTFAEPSVNVTVIDSFWGWSGLTVATLSADTTVTADTGKVLTLSSGVEIKSGSKKVDGVSYTNKARIKKSTTKITFDTVAGAAVKVAAASASSSETRNMLIMDSAGNIETFPLSSAETVTFTPQADGTVTIWATSGVDVYGVYCTETITN